MVSTSCGVPKSTGLVDALALEIAVTPFPQGSLAYLLALAFRQGLILSHAHQFLHSHGLQGQAFQVPNAAMVGSLHKFYELANVLLQLAIHLQRLLLLSLGRLKAVHDLAVGLLLQIRHVAQDHVVHVEQEVHPLLISDQTQLRGVLEVKEKCGGLKRI